MTRTSVGKLICVFSLFLQPGIAAPADVPRHQPDAKCITDWLVLGPFFPDALDRDFLSAVGGESQASPKDGDAVTRPSGEKLAWKHRQSRTEAVDLNELLGPQERATAYAFCLIESDRPTVGTLRLGSDDGASVFLNGERILYRPVNRSFLLDEDVVPLLLAKGTNRLLVKVSKGVAAWELYAREETSYAAVINGVVSDRRARP
jgi:hypothetical protein